MTDARAILRAAGQLEMMTRRFERDVSVAFAHDQFGKPRKRWLAFRTCAPRSDEAVVRERCRTEHRYSDQQKKVSGLPEWRHDNSFLKDGTPEQ